MPSGLYKGRERRVDFARCHNQHWGWTGLTAQEIVGRNAFGNILVLDQAGRYWRICPEALSCEPMADTAEGFGQHTQRRDFEEDWDMERLVGLARNAVGPLETGTVYYLVVPAVLGGAYGVDNIRTAPLEQVIALSGDWAREIKDLPDGAQIKLRLID